MCVYLTRYLLSNCRFQLFFFAQLFPHQLFVVLICPDELTTRVSKIMNNTKLNTHDCKIAVTITRLWMSQIKPSMTQTAFAQKYGFEQNFISQVFNFHSAARHAFICSVAKELSCQPIDIDPLFNDPSRFRK